MPFRCPPSNTSAFTRLDLVAITAAVGLLFLMAVPVLAKPGVLSRAAVCQANHHTLIRAWQLYAMDNTGSLVAASGGQRSPEWNGGGWLDYTIKPDNVDPAKNLMKSPLWRYTDKRAETFRCPSDLSTNSLPSYQNGEAVPRVRSYSMNSWMGGPTWGASGSGWTVWFKLDSFTTIRPSEAFVFTDERADSINDGYFVVDMTGYPNTPTDQRLTDFPASYHEGAANISFADGHVESHRWLDPRTTPPLVPNKLIILNVSSPGNADVSWLQAHASRPR